MEGVFLLPASLPSPPTPFPLPFLPSPPLPLSFPSSPHPLEVGPLKPAMWSGERRKLPKWVRGGAPADNEFGAL